MKTVLLTGADRGLGLALAREYLARGYTVFAGRFLPEYALLDALHEAYPDRLFPVPLDVSDRQSILDRRTPASGARNPSTRSCSASPCASTRWARCSA